MKKVYEFSFSHDEYDIAETVSVLANSEQEAKSSAYHIIVSRLLEQDGFTCDVEVVSGSIEYDCEV